MIDEAVSPTFTITEVTNGRELAVKVVSVRFVLRALAGIALMALTGMAGAGMAEAAKNGVYVDVRERDDPNSPVLERWKLYGPSYALVIGIDNYTNGWPRLSNAVKDAERVAKALEGRGFDVTVLKNVTGDQLRLALRKFYAIKGAEADARLFVWYSGHGHTEQGEGYLVPADAPLPGNPEFRFSALHMRDFSGLVRLAQAKHAMAIFDSCFAGTVFNVQRSKPPAAITRATVKPVRQFLTSGDADQQVSDDGTFSRLFIDALEDSARADANKDGYVTGSELGIYMETRVTNLTNGQQTPRSGKLRDPRYDGGDFVFVLPQATPLQTAKAVPKAEPATPQTVGPSEAALDLEFWNAIKDSANPGDYQAYLDAFPNGRFAPLARRRSQLVSAQTRSADPAPQAQTKHMQKQDTKLAARLAELEKAREEDQKRYQALLDQQKLAAANQQVARLTPTEPPLKSQEEVERYLEDSERRLLGKLTQYNRKYGVLLVNGSKNHKVKIIHSKKIRRLDGDSVFVEITFEAGSQYFTGAGTATFEMKWIDGELEFVGHKRPS